MQNTEYVEKEEDFKDQDEGEDEEDEEEETKRKRNCTPHQTTEWFRRGSGRWRAEREQQTPATLADYLLLYTDEIHL